MQDGLFAQVVLDHLGNEVVNALVVGGAVARRVHDGHVAGAVGAHQVGHADQAVGNKAQGIQVLVRGAAIHRAHQLVLIRVAVIELQVFNEKLARLGQNRARLLGKIGMLEVGRVVAPRGEHHVDAAAVDVVHGFAQKLAVVAVVLDGEGAEGLGVAAAAQVARHQRIRRTGRDAQIVLEHVPNAVVALHQVDARYVRINALRRHDLLALRKVARGGEGEGLRNHAVLDDALLAVKVAQIGVQCIDALHQATLKVIPLRSGDNARDGIEGEQALMELALFVQAEFNAVTSELRVDFRSLLNELGIHARPPGWLGFSIKPKFVRFQGCDTLVSVLLPNEA